METKIALRYMGPAVESGVMDVYEASANMIAFSEFVLLAAKAEYGDAIEARAEVAGFGRGSFITDLVFNVAGIGATVFSGLSAKDILSLIKQCFDLWKHLKGAPPAKVEHVGQSVNVTNNSGQIIQVSIPALTVVFSEKGSEAVGQFVQKALEKQGMDAVEIASGKGNVVERVTSDERSYFVAVAPSELVTDVVVPMALMLEAPVFKDGNKWRFSDGQQSFYANILDAEFLARVDGGERFGKGDVLYGDVRISQEQSGMKLSAERTILKIHRHKMASQQLKIPDA